MLSQCSGRRHGRPSDAAGRGVFFLAGRRRPTAVARIQRARNTSSLAVPGAYSEQGALPPSQYLAHIPARYPRQVSPLGVTEVRWIAARSILFAFVLLFGPPRSSRAGPHALSEEDVITLNTQGICPVNRIVLAADSARANIPPLPQIDPVSAQWSAALHLRPGQSVESSGLSAVGEIILTCRARVAGLGGLREAIGDLSINGERFTDALGNEWRWSYEPKSKLLTLTPLPAYADRASVENDAPTLLPVGFLFKSDWTSRLTFVRLIDRDELLKALRHDGTSSRRAQPSARRKRARRPPPARADSQLAKAGRAGGVAPLTPIPTGTSPEAKFDYYAGQAAVFRKYHDSGALNEKELLNALVKKGLMAPKRGGAGYAWTPTPFPVLQYRSGFRWPLDAGLVTSEYGRRWGKNHDGMDIAANRHEPVFASADGQIVYAGNGLSGYGNAVIIRHDVQTVTLYAHNTSLMVRDGDWVRSGRLIALVGSTGHSTGPHVHFEIRVAGRPIDPRRELPKTRF